MRKLWIAVCCLAAVSVGAAAVPVHVFVPVAVVDVATGKVLTDRAVVVRGGTIESVVAADGFTPPAGATVIKAADKFLIPGLWDMHTHHEFPWEPMLGLAVANGVTGVRDLNSEPFVLKWRDDIRGGKRVGPRIVAAGKYLDAKRNGQPPGRETADTPEKAREMVQARKKAGADFIKVYSGLSDEVFRAVVDEAKAQKLPVAGHCPERVSTLDASALGQRSLEHCHGIAVACSSDEAALRKRIAAAFDNPNGYDLDDLAPVEQAARETQDADKRAALFAAFKKNRTWVTPTLVVMRPLAAKGSDDARLKYTHVGLTQLWERIQEKAPQEAMRKNATAFARTAVTDMHKAGVPLLCGTDAGGSMNVRVFLGFSVADELELLVECGLTPADALRTATLNPAECLDELKTSGTIDAGKRADLVLLDADPLKAIGNVRKIAGVMTGGTWHDRTALDKMLESAAAATGQRK